MPRPDHRERALKSWTAWRVRSPARLFLFRWAECARNECAGPLAWLARSPSHVRARRRTRLRWAASARGQGNAIAIDSTGIRHAPAGARRGRSAPSEVCGFNGLIRFVSAAGLTRRCSSRTHQPLSTHSDTHQVRSQLNARTLGHIRAFVWRRLHRVLMKASPPRHAAWE
jgi:hypothetical protein